MMPNFVVRFRDGPLDPEKALRWGQRRCSELLLVGEDGLAGKWKKDASPPPNDKKARQQIFGNLRNWKVAPYSYESLTDQQYSALENTTTSTVVMSSSSLKEEREPASSAAVQRKRRRSSATTTSARSTNCANKKKRTEEAAASSGEEEKAELVELPASLCELLGRSQLPKVRKHPMKKLYSLLDVGAAMLDRDEDHASKDLRQTLDKFPELAENLSEERFSLTRDSYDDNEQRKEEEMSGHHNTNNKVKLGGLSKVVEYIMLLPGKMAARVRCQAARLLVRHLGGDDEDERSLVTEVCALRHVQESLAETDPTNWRRAVDDEASSSKKQQETTTPQTTTSTVEASSLLQQMMQMLANQQTQIAELYRQVGELRDANLRSEALPVMVYLKQRLPNTPELRRIILPTFSTRLRDLKLEICRAEGTEPLYVTQTNHHSSSQLLYLRSDRPLMDKVFEQIFPQDIDIDSWF